MGGYFLDAEENEEVKADEEAGDDDADGDKEQRRERQNTGGVRKANMLFHLIMTFGSFYMAMFLSNWGTQTPAGETASKFSKDGNIWILIISQWLCMALYFWSLVLHRVGPVCCPDRDWDQE